MAETLRQKQSRFLRMTTLLMHYADLLGYELTYGDAHRPRDAAYGHPRSLHKDRLALDINLFKGGEFLASTEDHRPLGEFWKFIGGTWGGDFGDGNHYSLAHAGRK